jgi:hypothetical protein
VKRYELKDKERQAALEKVFPGFGRLLNEACSVCPADTVVHISSRRVAGQDFPHFYELSFPRSIIEEVVAYDPKGWNDYPEVTPPECVLMQIEGRDDDDDAFHFSGYFKNRMWVDEYGYALATNIYTVERFRPWDEKEEK